jgi:hypothetical protein
MDKAREGEEQENGHAEHEMQLEDRVHVGDVEPGVGLQRQHALRPIHELYHFMPVQMAERNDDGAEPQQQLRKQNEQDRRVAEGRRGADARIGQPAMGEQADADEAHQAGAAADDNGQLLLEGMGNAERVNDGDGRQQAGAMAEENDEDADVEQVGAPHQLLAAQEL